MSSFKQNISVLPTKIEIITAGTVNVKGNQLPLGVPLSGNFDGYVTGWTSNTTVTDAIDQLNKGLIAISGITSTATKSVKFFNSTDWNGPVNGYYSLEYLSSAHNKGIYPTYLIEELISTSYYGVLPDNVNTNNLGDITLYVIDLPDGRFSGRIIVL
jgi:hypothetical protein